MRGKDYKTHSPGRHRFAACGREAETTSARQVSSVNGEIVTEPATSGHLKRRHQGSRQTHKCQAPKPVKRLHPAQQTKRLPLQRRRPRRPQARRRPRQRPRPPTPRRTPRLQHRRLDNPHQRRRIYQFCRIVKDDPKGLRGQSKRPADRGRDQ